MEFILAIELSPVDYSKNDYQSPDGTFSEFPNEWNDYWLKCLSDSNLGHLFAIKKGSFLVDINTIDETALEEIIKLELSKYDEDELSTIDFEEQLIGLCGGIVIKENNQLLIKPNCCGDLENLNEWKNIFVNDSNDWTHLWIGHPWIFYRKGNGIIEFSNYSDANLEDFHDIHPVITLSELEMKIEFNKITQQHDSFEMKIRKILENMSIKNSHSIAKILSGNC